MQKLSRPVIKQRDLSHYKCTMTDCPSNFSALEEVVGKLEFENNLLKSENAVLRQQLGQQEPKAVAISTIDTRDSVMQYLKSLDYEALCMIIVKYFDNSYHWIKARYNPKKDVFLEGFSDEGHTTYYIAHCSILGIKYDTNDKHLYWASVQAEEDK